MLCAIVYLVMPLQMADSPAYHCEVRLGDKVEESKVRSGNRHIMNRSCWCPWIFDLYSEDVSQAIFTQKTVNEHHGSKVVAF